MLLLGVTPCLYAADVEKLLNTLPQRQNQCLQSIAQEINSSTVIRGAAHLFLGEEIEQANAAMRTFEGSSSTLVNNLTFLRLLNTFLEDSDIVHSPTRKHIEQELAQFLEQRESLISSPFDENVPESHQIVKNTYLFLWARYVKSASLDYVWPNQGTTEDHEKLYRQEIIKWLNFRALYGYQERSSAYYTHNLAALLCLRDFCKDENLIVKVDGAIDLMVADIAQESLNGHWGGARCRSFEAISSPPGAYFYFILFGIPRDEAVVMPDPSIIHLAATGYRPPPVLVRIAHEWKYRGTYEVKTRYCVDRDNPEAGLGRKYSYVTPNFILGSFQTRNELSPWQTRPWDLLVRGEDNEGHHMFTFTGEQLFSGGAPPYEKEFYLWNTTSFQHKNVLFCKFHRSDRKRAGFQSLTSGIDHRFVQWPTRLWVPNEFAPFVEENGWWFAQVGDVYIGCRSLTGSAYWWRSGLMRGGENINAAILTFHKLDTAFLLEVESASNFSSFTEFKQEISQSPLVVEDDWATFVSRRGDVYLFSLKGERFLVNGTETDPWTDPEYQLYSSPFTHSDYGSGIFTARWEPYAMKLDMSEPSSPKRIMTQNE